jgi:tetratricopeptide (TPR) repeat protein
MSTHRPPPIQADYEDEILDELARLREEAMQARHVAIKTENLVKSLGVEMKQVGHRQAYQERRSFFNSSVAYVLFVVLVFVGLYMNFQAKVETYGVKLDERGREIGTLERQVADLTRSLERWQQIEKELLEFEHLITTGKKEQAVKHFSDLRLLSFSGLLEELVVKFKSEVARDKYDQGVKTFEQKNFSRAKALFEASLEYEGSPPYLGDLLYYQGKSLLRLENYKEAIKLLTKAQTFKHERKVRADIDYNLARAYDMENDKRAARRLWYRFYLRYRHTEKHRAQRAKRRYERLDKERQKGK